VEQVGFLKLDARFGISNLVEKGFVAVRFGIIDLVAKAFAGI